jgi:hypothetical protein
MRLSSSYRREFGVNPPATLGFSSILQVSRILREQQSEWQSQHAMVPLIKD